MSDIKMSRADLSMELEECMAITKFLSMAINLILVEAGNFTDESGVPWGASSCIDALTDKLKKLETQI